MRVFPKLMFSIFLIFVGSVIAEPKRYSVQTVTDLQVKQSRVAVDAAVKQTSIGTYDLFTQQSFHVAVDDKTGFSLFNGKGAAENSESIPINMCFAVIAPDDKPLSSYILPTIGSWNWEALSCEDVIGVGFISDKLAGFPKVLILYSAHSPNEASKPAVLLAWNNKSARYQIDERMSKRTEDVSDRTVKGIISSISAIK